MLCLDTAFLRYHLHGGRWACALMCHTCIHNEQRSWTIQWEQVDIRYADVKHMALLPHISLLPINLNTHLSRNACPNPSRHVGRYPGCCLFPLFPLSALVQCVQDVYSWSSGHVKKTTQPTHQTDNQTLLMLQKITQHTPQALHLHDEEGESHEGAPLSGKTQQFAPPPHGGGATPSTKV